jgi:hypothetical protein
MIYQHEVRGADRAITDAIDTQVQGKGHNDGDDGGTAGALAPAG